MSFRASPSQLTTWKLCNRKWFYAKVLGLPEPQSASTQLGSDVHAALENYIERKPVVADGEVGRILTHIWESPLVQKMREVKASVEAAIDVTIEGVPLIGRIDAHWFEGPVAYIVDHKTTKDFKWAKTEQEAIYDPQTIVYCLWALSQPGIERAVFHYHYIKTTSPAVPPRLVTVEHTWESLEPWVEAAGELLRNMQHAKGLTEHEVERTPEACHAFGGCAFRAQCWQSPASTKEFAVTDFTNKLNAMWGTPNETSAAPVTVSAPKFNPPAPSTPAPPPPAVQQTNTPEQTATNGLPVIYFGCAPTNVQYEFLETFLDRCGFLKRFSDGNKGQHYLNSDFNRGPGVVAVDFVTAVHKGTITLPPHLVVAEHSAIGRFLQIEQRYLEPKAILISRSPF